MIGAVDSEVESDPWKDRRKGAVSSGYLCAHETEKRRQ